MFLSLRSFDSFGSHVLDLGDLAKEGSRLETLAVVFDLEGFTGFCNQLDPHLVIPKFLDDFLNWLFGGVAVECSQKEHRKEVELWSPLPFFAKYLGDGVLFLWNTEYIAPFALGNIVVALENICRMYSNRKVLDLKKRFTRVPPKLRCGIARGQVISLGEDRDFVGPCINVAARIQKLSPFSFAFSSRGFDPDTCFTKETKKSYVMIKTPIRGLGEDELIYMLSTEFKQLPAKERKRLTP